MTGVFKTQYSFTDSNDCPAAEPEIFAQIKTVTF
jgi:hypothetical protein